MDFSQYAYLVAANLALLVPAGLILIGSASMEPEEAWGAALGGLAAISLAGLGYWATGFALQFGGVGLFHPQAGLDGLVWEWSALPEAWGTGWGTAGLRGWFLQGESITPMAYHLFLAHLPWAITAALLPAVALRGRAPAPAVLLLALLTGGVLYPLAGNWVQGGGWLAGLGTNLSLGHGFVDFGGSGGVFVLAAGVALAGVLIWLPRSARKALHAPLAPAQLPLLAVVGALLFLVGTQGWLWANPIQTAAVGELGPLRTSVNVLLAALGGGLLPLLYTWFVTGESEPSMAARGLVAGVVAALAGAPFMAPLVCLLLGLIAGGTVPFVAFLGNRILRLNDRSGALMLAGVPGVLGLLAVGLFADGAQGVGWQGTGFESYLGVANQGVSGLFVTSPFRHDFPGQLQAQVIGAATLGLWGFALGTLICAPLAVLLHGIEVASSRARGGAPDQRPDQDGHAAGSAELRPQPTPLPAVSGYAQPVRTAASDPADNGAPRAESAYADGYTVQDPHAQNQYEGRGYANQDYGDQHYGDQHYSDQTRAGYAADPRSRPYREDGYADDRHASGYTDGQRSDPPQNQDERWTGPSDPPLRR